MPVVLTREPPAGLLSSLRTGGCVAFVGAGFSQPAVPGWASLLRSLATRLPEGEVRDDVEALLVAETPSAIDLEAAAQMIRGALTGPAFDKALKAALTVHPRHRERLDARLKLLTEIPFAAVLTTNFDPFLRGDAPTPDVYYRLLRSDSRWSRGARSTVKLHGDVADARSRIVLSREDYRARLYQDGRYATFLRAVFATRTVLFLGVSFTDAYLNELRSEVLSLLGPPADAPLAYAILPDCTPARARYFRSHEGIEVLGYDSNAPVGHAGFDRLLTLLHAATRPYATLRSALAGRRILWLDPNRENNAWGRATLDEGEGVFTAADTVEEAMAQLEVDYDLVITHYGWSPVRDPAAVRLLRALRSRERGVPVMVFASPTDAATRRREVRALGAIDYCHRWEDLFVALEAFFRPRPDEDEPG